MPKNDVVKKVFDAKCLKSVTDLTNYSWSIKPEQIFMTRVKGNVISVIGIKQYTYTRGLYGQCGLPNLFSRLMMIILAPAR